MNVQDVTVENESKKPRFVIQDDKVYFSSGGKEKPELQTGRAADRVKRYIGIKNAYNNLYDITTNPESTEDQKSAARAELEKAYDSFYGNGATKANRAGTDFGALQSDQNKRELRRDSEYWKLTGIERYIPSTEKGIPGKYAKTDIFTKDTFTKKKTRIRFQCYRCSCNIIKRIRKS